MKLGLVARRASRVVTIDAYGSQLRRGRLHAIQGETHRAEKLFNRPASTPEKSQRSAHPAVAVRLNIPHMLRTTTGLRVDVSTICLRPWPKDHLQGPRQPAASCAGSSIGDNVHVFHRHILAVVHKPQIRRSRPIKRADAASAKRRDKGRGNAFRAKAQRASQNHRRAEDSSAMSHPLPEAAGRA